MSTHLSLGKLEGWLRRQRGFPASCGRPFAALLAHYGQRLDRPPHEEALRKALIKYLDRAEPRRDEEEFDLIPDQAALLLDEIEKARGGCWPIEAPGEQREYPLARRDTTIQIERGLGKKGGRGLTDENVLLVLAAFIVATETSSIAAALETVLDVFRHFGLPAPDSPGGAQATVSRTRKLMVDLLAEYGAAELSPSGVRAAYVLLADRLEKGHTKVCVPRAPDGLS